MIIIIASLSVLVTAYRTARAEILNPVAPVSIGLDSRTMMVAQNETQTSGTDKGSPTSESNESKSKTDDKKESSVTKTKPLKDFKPSERIEAEQAVDFPYDI